MIGCSNRQKNYLPEIEGVFLNDTNRIDVVNSRSMYKVVPILNGECGYCLDKLGKYNVSLQKRQKEIIAADTSYYFYLLTRDSILLNYYLESKDISFQIYIDEGYDLLKMNPKLKMNKSYLLNSDNELLKMTNFN